MRDLKREQALISEVDGTPLPDLQGMGMDGSEEGEGG